MVVRDILDGIDDVHFAQLTSTDVVRHRLVADIVDAYSRWDADTQQPALRSAAPRNGPPLENRGPPPAPPPPATPPPRGSPAPPPAAAASTVSVENDVVVINRAC